MPAHKDLFIIIIILTKFNILFKNTPITHTLTLWGTRIF